MHSKEQVLLFVFEHPIQVKNSSVGIQAWDNFSVIKRTQTSIDMCSPTLDLPFREDNVSIASKRAGDTRLQDVLANRVQSDDSGKYTLCTVEVGNARSKSILCTKSDLRLPDKLGELLSSMYLLGALNGLAEGLGFRSLKTYGLLLIRNELYRCRARNRFEKIVCEHSMG